MAMLMLGLALAQAAADLPVRVPLGEVTLEPANVTIGWFRNLSTTAPASLVCTFLAGHDDHELSRMLPAQ